MEKRIIFLFLVLLVFLPLTIAAAEPAKRALEIVYPKIPGVETPEYVSGGLPDYVNYIFRFSVIFFGILIFAVLIYNGIKYYLLSFGNPAKTSEATQGMLAAGLGGVILLGAYLIFNTINPQLLILTPPEIGMLKAYIVPGAYICNYNVKDIGDILSKYTTNIPEVPADASPDAKKQAIEARENALKIRTEAAEKLKDAMGKPGPGPVCFLANYSGPLQNFVIKAGSTDWTIFMIPSEAQENKWEYDFGIILHENDKYGGQCQILPTPRYVENEAFIFYPQAQNQEYHPQLGFDAKSVTVFQRPYFEPDPGYKGVTLYEGLAWNEVGKAGVVGNCGGKSTCTLLPALGLDIYTACSVQCGPTEIPIPQCRTFPPWASTCPCQEVSQCKGGSSLPVENYVSLQNNIFSSLLSSFFALAEVDLTLISWPDKPGQGFDAKEIRLENIKKGGKSLRHNTKSVAIEPKDGYFAVIFGNGVVDSSGNFKFFKNCEIRKTSTADITAGPMGRCGVRCNVISLFVLGSNAAGCEPCAEDVYIIKGQVLQ